MHNELSPRIGTPRLTVTDSQPIESVHPSRTFNQRLHRWRRVADVVVWRAKRSRVTWWIIGATYVVLYAVIVSHWL